MDTRNAPDGPLRRPVDAVERFFMALDTVQRQNFVLHARLSRVVDESEVRQAFARLLAMNETLRTAAALGADAEPLFVPLAVRSDTLCLIGPTWEPLRSHALMLDVRGTPRHGAAALGVSSQAWIAGHALVALRDAAQAAGQPAAALALSHAADLRRFGRRPPPLGCRAGVLLRSHRLSATDTAAAVATAVHRWVQSALACAFPVWLLKVLPWLNAPGGFGPQVDAARADIASAPSWLVISDLGSVDRECEGVAGVVAQAGLTVQPLPGQLAVLTRVDLAGRSHLRWHTRPTPASAGLLQALAAGLADRLGARPLEAWQHGEACLGSA